MHSIKIRHPLANVLLCMLLLSLLSGCRLPFVPQLPGVTSPAVGSTQVPQTGIPPQIFTQVAATIYAPLQATWTQQAQVSAEAVQPTSPPSATAELQAPAPTPAQPETGATNLPNPTPTSPSPIPPTTAPEIPALLPTATTGLLPLEPTFIPQPTIYAPANPPEGYFAQGGHTVRVAGVNLPSCGGTLVSNFMILNSSGSAIESTSIHVIDLSTGLDIYGPMVNNASFMFDDRSCSPGGWSNLNSGYALFIGAAMNVGDLSGHLLQANFLFCTDNNLTGHCTSRSVEFVVPLN